MIGQDGLAELGLRLFSLCRATVIARVVVIVLVLRSLLRLVLAIFLASSVMIFPERSSH